MGKLLDKLIVFLLCVALYVQYVHGLYSVVPVICAVSASALNSYLERDAWALGVFIAYWAVCLLSPGFLFFLPLICYDIFSTRGQYAAFAALVPIVAAMNALTPAVCLFIALFTVISWFIKYRAVSIERIKSGYIALRDTAREFSLQLEAKNQELLDKQDYEINLATLNERNRIARDIHDSIGHVLSNSILQTGALMATCKDDEALHKSLTTLKDTLVRGMDSVRDSIHGLYDESIDLYTEAKALADGFRFCEVTLDYDIAGNPEKKVKFTLLAVIKEALSNIIRHSDATRVTITLTEHPALYQLAVRDNGSKKEQSGEGIGLKNITQRVQGLKGIVNISDENGFSVFVSIPKEK